MTELVHINTHKDPAALLEKAKDWGMTECLVIGYDADGDLVCGGTVIRHGDCILMAEQFKQFILEN